MNGVGMHAMNYSRLRARAAHYTLQAMISPQGACSRCSITGLAAVCECCFGQKRDLQPVSHELLVNEARPNSY